MKVIHVDPKVNAKFVEWCESNHSNCGSAIVKRGKIHACLGIKLHWTEKGKLMVDMRDHVKDMIDENLTEIKCNAVP